MIAPGRRSIQIAAALLLLGAACRDHGGSAAQPVAGGDPARGRAAITAYGCGGCHAIPGVAGARARVGPPLTNFADRAYVAGKLPNQPAQLVRWIRDPQGVTPGTAMPNLGVTEAHARDIAAYLYTLGAGGLGSPHLLPPRLLPH